MISRNITRLRKELLQSFHNVFTLPHELNPLTLCNKKVIFDMLFGSVSETLLQFGKNSENGLGGKLGFSAILHSWDQTLMDHFHLHCVIPAGVLSFDHSRWIPAGEDFLFHVKALSRVFRGKFMDHLEKAFANGQLLFAGNSQPLGTSKGFCRLKERLWEKDWVVDCLPVGNGSHCLKYLAPYIHRVALTNSRILAAENGQVRFRYKPSDSTLWKLRTLPALEFIALFLQHILPRGFMKVRYYGLLASASRTALRRIRLLVLGSRSQPPQPLAAHPKPRSCPVCGGPLRLLATFLPPRGPPAQWKTPPLPLPATIR